MGRKRKKIEVRPIDAEELKRQLKKKKEWGVEVLGTVFDLVNSMPTVQIDVSQGNVLGKWEVIYPKGTNVRPGFKCSTCGKIERLYRTDFCRHCGSDNRIRVNRVTENEMDEIRRRWWNGRTNESKWRY